MVINWYDFIANCRFTLLNKNFNMLDGSWQQYRGFEYIFHEQQDDES